MIFLINHYKYKTDPSDRDNKHGFYYSLHIGTLSNINTNIVCMQMNVPATKKTH